MRVSIYSIPATGTRFVSAYLRHIGAEYSRRHVGDPPPCAEYFWVLPVRNPYDCYLSFRYSYPDKTDDYFVELWETYIYGDDIDWNSVFYFPLDTPDREGTLKALAVAAEREYRPFLWRPVGRTDRDRRTMIPEAMRYRLGFAHDWYLAHTV